MEKNKLEIEGSLEEGNFQVTRDIFGKQHLQPCQKLPFTSYEVEAVGNRTSIKSENWREILDMACKLMEVSTSIYSAIVWQDFDDHLWYLVLREYPLVDEVIKHRQQDEDEMAYIEQRITPPEGEIFKLKGEFIECNPNSTNRPYPSITKWDRILDGNDMLILRVGKKMVRLTRALLEEIDCFAEVRSNVKQHLEETGEGFVEAFEEKTGISLTK